MLVRTVFCILVATILLAACSTGPASRGPGYPNYPPNYPPGYPSPNPYPRGPGYGTEQLRNLADSLELATDKLERSFTEAEPPMNSDDISKIKDLHDESSKFLKRIDEQQMGPSRTDENFQKILDSYYESRDIVRNLADPSDRTIQNDFDRVTRMMRGIANFYGYQLEREEYQDPIVR